MSVRGNEPAGPTRVLISSEALHVRVTELGGAIARDYANDDPLLVGILKGALVFMADLIRAIPIAFTTDTIGVSSYGDGIQSSGRVELTCDLAASVEGRHVLIIDDIVDTGRTIAYVKRKVEMRGPRSVRLCVLLGKRERREVAVDVDYLGFSIPDVYAVGYGLDYAGRYRNLPHIAMLEKI